MNRTNQKKSDFKKRALHELQLYIFYTLFLTLFFWCFLTYRKILLQAYAIPDLLHFGYGLVQALILAKIILIGQHFEFTKKFSDTPLIVSTLYKAIVFCLLVILFNIIEHFLDGIITGKNLTTIYQDLINKNINEILAQNLVTFFVFFLFFAFLEMGRATVGEDKLLQLFFQRHSKK